MLDAGEMLPVIESGSATCFFIHVESKWMDQVQHTASSNGRTADVPGIVGDLGCQKHDVEEWIIHERDDRCVR